MHRMFLAAPLALGLFAAPALAEQAGLVNVSLGDVVVQDIANDLNVNVSQIPVTVQAPIGVAATVCDVNANVLAEQRKAGDATCTAKSNSTALAQIVQRQMAAQ